MSSDSTPRTILVTGATGRVGGAVLGALTGREGVAVRAAVRDPASAALGPPPAGVGRAADPDRETDGGAAAARDEAPPDADTGSSPESDVGTEPESPAEADNVTTVEFDFARPETWGAALDGVDALFLMRPPAAGSSEVTGFAEAAVRVGVSRIAYLSVMGAERNRLIPHYRIERAIESLPVQRTFLRAGQFMQNLADVHAPEIRERDEVFVPAGGGEMAFVDARDVGEVGAAALVAERAPPAAYEVTGDGALDHDEVAQVLSAVLGRRIEYADPSPIAFARRMRGRGVGWPMIGVTLALYTSARLGFGSRTGDGVRRALGRDPRTLREFAEDYRAVWER